MNPIEPTVYDIREIPCCAWKVGTFRKLACLLKSRPREVGLDRDARLIQELHFKPQRQ
jgi:hypothetical protein